VNNEMHIIKVISAIRMRGVRHVAYMEEKLNGYRVFMNNLNVRGCYDDGGIDGRIALKCILRKWDGCGLNYSDKPRNSL
jgi:hypothetical protein